MLNKLNQHPGVYLVGSGPGDPGLLTIKAQALLESCDILVHDFLVSDQIMGYVNPAADEIYVGKKGFTRHITQDEINELLVQLATKNPEAVIVRLKGGDPYVFGRGGEEGLALHEAGISFEVVPGVTSGIAALAYAGIPATHRGLAASMAFITGHEDPTKPNSQINWEYLAKGVDTLIFYMGVKNLPNIVENLTKYGRPLDEPVALVRWGTNPEQESLVSDLEHVVKEVGARGFKAPAIICVGKVVELKEALSFFENKPLHGKTIAITRARAQASNMHTQLLEAGAKVIEFPTIKIEPCLDHDELIDFCEHVGEYSWLVFTSVNGVDTFFDGLLEIGKDSRALSSIKVASIGSATAEHLLDRGIVPDLIPDEYKAEGVLEALLERGVGSGDKVVIARAKKTRQVLNEGLEAKGVEVKVMEVYETHVDGGDIQEAFAEALKAGEIDAISFSSSSTVDNFIKLIKDSFESEEEMKSYLEKLCIASIGPITSKTLNTYGIAPTIEAEEFTINCLVQDIISYFKKQFDYCKLTVRGVFVL